MYNLCEEFKLWHDERVIQGAIYCFARLDAGGETVFEVGIKYSDGTFEVRHLKDVILERYITG